MGVGADVGGDAATARPALRDIRTRLRNAGRTAANREREDGSVQDEAVRAPGERAATVTPRSTARVVVEVDRASDIAALTRFLNRAGCSVDRVAGRTLRVSVDAAADEQTASEQIEAYLRVWAANGGNGAARLG